MGVRTWSQRRTRGSEWRLSKWGKESESTCAQSGRPWGVILAGMCKSVLPEVEGKAFPGAELIDLTKISRSPAFEVEQT